MIITRSKRRKLTACKEELELKCIELHKELLAINGKHSKEYEEGIKKVQEIENEILGTLDKFQGLIDNTNICSDGERDSD